MRHAAMERELKLRKISTLSQMLQPFVCESCGGPVAFYCLCRKVAYCTPACQLKDKARHVEMCTIVKSVQTDKGYNDFYKIPPAVDVVIRRLADKGESVVNFTMHNKRPAVKKGKIVQDDNMFYHCFRIPIPTFVVCAEGMVPGFCNALMEPDLCEHFIPVVKAAYKGLEIQTLAVALVRKFADAKK